ncbi:MAG: hypothetical protein ACRDAM_14290 [Casimicrobium sp.]
MSEVSNTTSVAHSKFIDGLAWGTLVVSGFLVFVAAFFLLITLWSNPWPQVEAILQDMQPGYALPSAFRFVFRHFAAIMFGTLVFSVVSFVCALALLRRKNWARIAFIVLLAANVVLNVATLFVLPSLFSSSGAPSANVPPAVRESTALMTQIASGINFVLIAVLSLLMVWMIKRLLARDVRHEFID